MGKSLSSFEPKVEAWSADVAVFAPASDKTLRDSSEKGGETNIVVMKEVMEIPDVGNG